MQTLAKKTTKDDIILSKLKEIVGDERATNDEAAMFSYSYDKADLSTPENPDTMPDYLVMPTTVEQVQGIVMLANEEKTPITPCINAANMGGLTIPKEGGIVVDLHLMNKIVKINEESNYMIVEPGVTVGTVDHELRKRGRWVGMPYAPPAAASMMGNILLSGVGHLASWYGSQGDLLNSLQAVLPTGEIVRLGSAAITNSWHSRYAVPDLTGLFMNWQGTTGIVTKISFPIWMRPEYLDAFSFAFDSYEEAIWGMMVPWQRREMSVDVTGFTWDYAHVLTDKYPLKKPEGEPLCFVFITNAGHTKDEVEFRGAKLKEFYDDQKRAGKIPSAREQMIPEEMKKFRVNMPTPRAFGFADHRLGGSATWTGSFTPVDGWVDGLKKIDGIMEKHKLARATVFGHIVKGSHHGMFRVIIPYNPKKKGEIENVRQAQRELVENIVDHGGTIYKASPMSAEIMLRNKHADPNFYKLIKKIKGFLDPNGIMNPGKWGL